MYGKLGSSRSFDGFENGHRAQYFYDDGSGPFLEKAIKFGAGFQAAENSSQFRFSENPRTYNFLNQYLHVVMNGGIFKL